MKKSPLIALAVLLVAGAAHADCNPLGYLALYVDEARTDWCVNFAGSLTPFQMWVYAKPGNCGMICAEFSLSYPPNVIQSTVHKNTELISVELGDLDNGISVCFLYCQYINWFWIYNQELFLTDANPSLIGIMPHPGIYHYKFANCLDGYPLESFNKYNCLTLNCCGPIAVERTSWGAIKGLFE